MKPLIALLATIALLGSGVEFVTDYAEVLEGTPLAALPDGHTPGDGHEPADHGVRCDNCHFGGVHLIGVVPTAGTFGPATHAQRIVWSPPAPVRVSATPPNRPPIV